MSSVAAKALVIVPTYNEALNIHRLLFTITRDVTNIDVLVVDDSSPDGTGDIVRRFAKLNEHVFLLERKQKDGLAQAYIAGFRWALERKYDYVVQMDADFSHTPNDINRFLEELKSCDAVVGCRYVAGGGIEGWGWLRQVISRGGNQYARTILGLPYQDLTGGFNGWRRPVLEAIQIDTIQSKGYAFQVELKNRAHRKHFRIKEIPIRFQNRELGKSKMTPKIVGEAAFRVLQMRQSH